MQNDSSTWDVLLRVSGKEKPIKAHCAVLLAHGGCMAHVLEHLEV